MSSVSCAASQQYTIPNALHIGDFADFVNKKVATLASLQKVEMTMSSSSSADNVLPPISELLKAQLADAPQEQYRPGGSYGVAPGPPQNQQWPVAQSLAPGPPAGRHPGHQSQYSSESMVSSEYTNRRSSYASSPSSAITSARESPVLPPLPGYPSSHSSAPIESNRDHPLPPMHPGGDPRYSHPSGTISPQRPQPYPPPGYPGRSPPQEHYMGPYPPRPPYGGQASGAPYGLNIEQHQGDYDGNKQKRRRGNLPKPVTDILRTWFQDHVAHPYPTEDEKQQLMVQTGLSLSQISNWFINARRRSLPQMHKQAQAESEIRDGQLHRQNN